MSPARCTFLAVGALVLAISSLSPTVEAGCCPNACSGHGTCTVDDACVCYSNWQVRPQRPHTRPSKLSTPLPKLRCEPAVAGASSPFLRACRRSIDEARGGTRNRKEGTMTPTSSPQHGVCQTRFIAQSRTDRLSRDRSVPLLQRYVIR